MQRKVNGNTNGIKDSVLNGICELYDCSIDSDTFVDRDLIERISYVTALVNREVLVYISRGGKVLDIRLGDDHSVHMEELRVVRNTDRLSGVRCIHTHPGSSGMLSGVDLGSLSSLKLDAMCAVGVNESGSPTDLYVAYLKAEDGGEVKPAIYGPFLPSRIPQKMLMDEIYASDRAFLSRDSKVTEFEPDKAVLVGIRTDTRYDSLDELASLAETAGIVVVGKDAQNKRTVDSATYIGSGKASDLSLLCSELEADIVIFDDELTAVQMKNLESILGLPVLDRTMLILDIFAQRASSREGKLQVELAQLQYRLPRLIGMGRILSRQGSSGVGMRGPGEKKLEIDRRRIRRRIYELGQDLSEIEKQRSLRREQRSGNGVPTVALVGYTNAGKSTILNLLSESDVMAEDMLFATLDPVVRRITLPNGQECLLSDTVGFINKLPHELIDAFKSTLEEVRNADLILHVIDASSDYLDVQIDTVEDVLSQLGASDTPTIRVYNKMDLIGADTVLKNDGIRISAKQNRGIEELLNAIQKGISSRTVRIDLLIPYEKYETMHAVRSVAKILNESHEENGTRLTVLLDEDELWKIRNMLD
ncbi:MAG: GTPase HflX [Clostridia bacterium]|nr:GTPase HflX [Clostridia bacterium]